LCHQLKLQHIAFRQINFPLTSRLQQILPICSSYQVKFAQQHRKFVTVDFSVIFHRAAISAAPFIPFGNADGVFFVKPQCRGQLVFKQATTFVS
jgi:hypothetical protein